MNWANTLRRWTMKSIHAAMLGSALLGAACVAYAQPPGTVAARLPKQYFTKNQAFDLPVDVGVDFRVTLREIRLYVKTPTSGWKLAESLPAHTTRFSLKVTQDGEYWYRLATVDRMGRMTPNEAAMANEPPDQRVVVDTTLPVILVQPTTTGANEFSLRCTIHDANPDLAALKAVCKTEFGDIPLEEAPNQPGVFVVKGAEPRRFPVVISAKDLAGNVAVKDVNIRAMIGIGAAVNDPKGPPDISQTVMRPETKDPVNLPTPRFDPPITKLETQPGPQRDFLLPRVDVPPPASDPFITKPPTIDEGPIKVPAVPTGLGMRPAGTLQLINTTHASVDYRIDQVGASGVGKVETYMTPDNGQSWHRVGENTGKASPANINLPGDGVYGIRIVVTNGNGFGGRAPVRGDMPQCTIEVDSTSPFVQMRPVEVIASTGQIELRWNAQDKNLGNEPISLSYRTHTDGPGLEIARKVKNDGVYRWTIPRDLGPQVFFRVEVTDQAGNLAQDVSRQPVVIDVTEPRATVVGVTGSSAPR